MAEFAAPSTFDVCALSPAREKVGDAESALKLVASLSDGAAVEAVKLSNKSYTAPAAHALAGKLATLRGLTDVDVSDVIAGRPEDEALEVLGALSAALAAAAGGGDAAAAAHTALDVSDNALGQKGIDALLPLFVGAAPLRSLKTCNNGMSEAAARQLADLATRSGSTALETFHYFNNMSGDGGAAAVARIVAASPGLVDLRFSGTRAGRAGSLEFARSLAGRHALVALDLADNSFGAEGGAVLGAWLDASNAKNGSAILASLNLRDCSLGDDGFAPVAAALGSCVALRALDISGNELTHESCGAPWLRALQALESLGVEENEIGSLGGAKLARALTGAKLPNLATFLTATNELASGGAIALCEAVLEAAPNLERLELNGNALDGAALERLAAALNAAGKGDILGEMDDNDEDLADDDDLEAYDWAEDDLAAGLAGSSI